MNTQHQKEINIKENVYFFRHSEMTPTRNVSKNRKTLDSYVNILQSVPLATERGISLIILTPKKILQQNLNRSTFFG
jgi:hypothetical protein